MEDAVVGVVCLLCIVAVALTEMELRRIECVVERARRIARKRNLLRQIALTSFIEAERRSERRRRRRLVTSLTFSQRFCCFSLWTTVNCLTKWPFCFSEIAANHRGALFNMSSRPKLSGWCKTGVPWFKDLKRSQRLWELPWRKPKPPCVFVLCSLVGTDNRLWSACDNLIFKRRKVHSCGSSRSAAGLSVSQLPVLASQQDQTYQQQVFNHSDAAMKTDKLVRHGGRT